MDTFAELNALNVNRERLMREGLTGVATIVGIRENVATTMLGAWHELDLDVALPDREPYRATRRVSLELSPPSQAPHIKVGAELPCESIRATTRRSLSSRRRVRPSR